MSAREMLVQGGRFYRMLVYVVLLFLMFNVVHGIDYDSFRNDKEPKMIMRRNNRPLRRVLENELSGSSDEQKKFTIQEGTEVLLHFGALLRFQILDIFGSLIFEHYEDFNLQQVEALFRIYEETMKRKYNIFEIVPSVLKHRDLKPSSLCRYINLHVKTCLKETAKNCMNLRKHDKAKLRRQFLVALNYTNYVYEESELRKYYPDTFFMDMTVRHLQQGMLTLDDKLVAGYLNNIQYDEYDERVREAEKQTVRYLLSSRHGTRKDNTRRSLSAFHISRFYTIAPLLRYYLQVNWQTFPDPISHQVHFLAGHVIKHVGSINPNIELLGTVYEGSVLHLKYLFDLVIPSDTVDPDVAAAKDYLLRKVTTLRIVDKFLRIEKYQQLGPEQLFMETMQQLKDIGFAKDIAMSLYVHARFWHRSVVIENLRDLLLMFSAYENLRTVPEHKRFMIIIDSIREHLWNAENVTIDIICNNPRACLRLGLEVVLKCDLVNVKIKNWIQLYFDFVNDRGSLMLIICNGPSKNITSTAPMETTESKTLTKMIEAVKVIETPIGLSTVATRSEEIVPEVETTPETSLSTTTKPAKDTTVVGVVTTEIPTTIPTVTITAEMISRITSNLSLVATKNSSIVRTVYSSVVTTPNLTTTEVPITETTTTVKPTTEPPSAVTTTLPELTTYEQRTTIVHKTNHETEQPITDGERMSDEATIITLPTTDGTETTPSVNCTTEQTNPTMILTTVTPASTTSALIGANKTAGSIQLETTTLLWKINEVARESSGSSSEEAITITGQSTPRPVLSSTEEIVGDCESEECSTESIPVTSDAPRISEVTNVTSGTSKVNKIDRSLTGAIVFKSSNASNATAKTSCEDSESCSEECSDENCAGSCTGPDCSGECIGPDCHKKCTGPNCSSECSGKDCTCKDCDTDESKSCVGPECESQKVECFGDDCDAASSSKRCADSKNCPSDSSSCSGDDCSRSQSVECTDDDCKKNQINEKLGGSKKKDVVVVCHNRDPHHQRKKERMQKMQQEIVGQGSVQSSHPLIPVNITGNVDKYQAIVEPLNEPVYFPPVFDPWRTTRIHRGRPLYPSYPPIDHPSSFYSDIIENSNRNHNKNTNINENWNYIQASSHQEHDAPEMREQKKSIRAPQYLDSYPDM